MFVRLVRFSFGPGKQDAAQDLANELVPAIGARPGCRAVTFFGDDSDGEYGLYVLWASQQDADTAAEVISPLLQRGLAGNVQGPPAIRLFQVIEPAN
jgi:quinol monooxygenase YgiN